MLTAKKQNMLPSRAVVLLFAAQLCCKCRYRATGRQNYPSLFWWKHTTRQVRHATAQSRWPTARTHLSAMRKPWC